MDNKKLGEKIKFLREQSGFTQDELAGKAKVARSALQRAEKGYVGPNKSTLEALAGALGVPIAEFFSLDAGELIPGELIGAKGLERTHKQSIQHARNERDKKASEIKPGRYLKKKSENKKSITFSSALELFSKLGAMSPQRMKLILAFAFDDGRYLSDEPQLLRAFEGLSKAEAK